MSLFEKVFGTQDPYIKVNVVTFAMSNNTLTADVKVEKRAIPKYIMTPHTKRIFEDFSRLADQQLQNQEGFVLLEGDAGTGKNYLVEMFAHHFNRELFEFHCSSSVMAHDLKSDKGTSEGKGGATLVIDIPSKIVNGLRTKNAIVLFDEINTLKPDVAKVLNRLFDSSRTLQWGTGMVHTTKADPTVLLVATQNPEGYHGVKPLADTLVSRSRKIFVDYPDGIETDSRGKVLRVNPDEAMMTLLLTKDFENLARDPDKFVAEWEKVVNGSGILSGLSGKQQRMMKTTGEIITLQHRLRKTRYDSLVNYQGNPVSVIFDIRMTKQAILEIEHLRASDRTQYGQTFKTDSQAALFKIIREKARNERERRDMAALVARSL